jgi:excisionase family DNA binding protein
MVEDDLPKGTFLTIEEIAKFLKVNPVTIRKLVLCGKLRSFKIGKQYRIEREDLVTYLEATRENLVKNAYRGKNGS